MPPTTKTLQMYEDVAVIKSQVTDIFKILKDNGQPGLVTRVITAETDIREIKNVICGEKEEAKKIEKQAEKIEVRKYEMSKSMKLLIYGGAVTVIVNLLLTVSNLK